MELLKKNSTQKILKTFVLIFLGTMALTISAKLKIPFYPVPMTMQTFVVLFLGLAFGYKIGLVIVGTYLFEGIIGIPRLPSKPNKGVLRILEDIFFVKSLLVKQKTHKTGQRPKTPNAKRFKRRYGGTKIWTPEI